ncbi:MAG: prenyltransferase/squalene oxidase repeat-containing protein [Pirellulales bacterium]
MLRRRSLTLMVAAFGVIGFAIRNSAQEPPKSSSAARTGRLSDQSIGDPVDDARAHRQAPRMEVLSDREWKRINDSVERALAHLASRQLPDGSFAAKTSGQPAITSLAVMAFLSAGYTPGEGRYGKQLDRAIDFALSCQREDGLFSFEKTIQPVNQWGEATHCATYNHAITGLMLGEVLGQTSADRAKRIRPAIDVAIDYARRLQERRKRFPIDVGGLRYIRDTPPAPNGGDSDLSITAWYLMFMRSAKNAGFEVPRKYVDEMLEFVRSCYQPGSGAFIYAHYTNGRYISRGMTGAGVLSLFLSGRYDTGIEQGAGRWILSQPFRPYGGHYNGNTADRYHYSAYYCSLASLQLGGRYWEQFYPNLAEVLIENQRADGSWPSEKDDADFGSCYSTSLAVLTLTPPYQLLPIYQR